MSLMYHVTLGEDDKLRIRPVDAIASLHDACCEIQDMHLDSQVRQTLDIRGSALDLQMRFKRGSAHAIRISVLESADRREHTDIVLHMPTNHRPHIGYLTVDAASSSLSEDIQSRIPENTKFDLAEDELLNVRILVDKCMVEVFVNDRVVLMQMMYLDDLKRSGFFDKYDGYCAKAGITWQDVIPPYDKAIGTHGAIAILRRNLAPDGAVIKHTACPAEMFEATLNARPFDSEEEAIAAVLSHRIHPGDAVLIRYEGPKGSGMPEMFYTSEAISSDRELGKSIALITDGRFSGASTDPSIGHVFPEAAVGGPIAFVEEGDLIHISIPERKIDIIGIHGQRKTPQEIDDILSRRRAAWKPRPSKYKSGILKLFSEHAVSPMDGGYMK